MSVVLFIAFVAACGSEDKPASGTTSTEVASGTTSTEAAKPAYTELPFTLDSTAAAVAVNDDGVYVADFGKGNQADWSGFSVSSDEGRVVLLETGANVQKDVVKVAAPIGMALGPDGSLYVVESMSMDKIPRWRGAEAQRVVKFPSGSTTPVPLLFPTDFPGPENVAVSEAGDVVVLYDSSVQTLPGEPNARVASTDVSRAFCWYSCGPHSSRALAVSRDGAIYFPGVGDTIMVIDKGASEPRKFAESGRGS